jgi:hypothetical protein
MNLTDTFKLFVTVTDAEYKRPYKIDMTKISAIFGKGFSKCTGNAQSILRYSDGDGKNIEHKVLEAPDTVENQIQLKQLSFLGSENLIKAFISVTQGKTRAKIAVDAINRIAPDQEDSSKNACYYACTQLGERRLNTVETPDQIEQQIEDKQRARVKYMKIMMGNAIF